MDKLDKLEALIDGAEELLTRLADAHNPDIQRLRDRVDHAIADARRTLSRQGEGGPARLRDLARALDDTVHDYPWLALLTGILAAGTMGFVAGAIAGSSRASQRLRSSASLGG